MSIIVQETETGPKIMIIIVIESPKSESQAHIYMFLRALLFKQVHHFINTDIYFKTGLPFIIQVLSIIRYGTSLMYLPHSNR